MEESCLDTPRRLSDLSLDSIVDKFLELAPESVSLHVPAAEILITAFSEAGKFQDNVISSSIFPPTGLRYLKVPCAANLTVKGLETLRNHPDLIVIRMQGLVEATVKDLLASLHPKTHQNLRLLDVSQSAFSYPTGKGIVEPLPFDRLKSLVYLNVSGTEFKKFSLELVASDIPTLKYLDISSTKVSDISPLKAYGDKLQSLSMYGLKFHADVSENVVDTLIELKGLVHLDISEERDEHPFDIFPNLSGLHIERLLEDPEALPNIVSLDISGKDEVTMNKLLSFISRRPKLKFLGLLLTQFGRPHSYNCIEGKDKENSGMVIAGSENEDQILESLRRYANRPQYVQKSLYHLFRITQETTTSRTDIIELVLQAARKYQRTFSIQMAATACLFNLCKYGLSLKLHPRILSEIVRVDLDAMEAFPQHKQLQKNVLLTICCDRILTEVNFDKYRCARLAMDCLCEWDDTSMNRMSVAICSILAAKITTTQTSELGSQPNYMKKLLSIVSNRMEERTIDITLKFTLSALWNLTDESPETSKMFLIHDGMPLFVDLLETFPGEASIETKILGLLNNIAEVHHLRSYLMNDSFLIILRKLLHASNIDVSYFAAGIVAHLASTAPICWFSELRVDEMTDDLWKVVMSWKIPKEEMVAYRSFRPFLPLMAVDQKHAVQLWAIWAIHHVCIKKAPRYCTMLKRQGGDVAILKLLNADKDRPHSAVRKLCESVMEVMYKEGLCPDSPFPASSSSLNEDDDASSSVYMELQSYT
ncbi:protein zyg-11 homolog B isoform X2 [Lepeophtheirus salmonis]|uniref:protein zyg-11 homolog B isoform X2 n=1 Tax=Lepeophtheirus salmonis TaxID=72036 RepID=UPI001AE54411|nr:protein zyg-11 homolog B-like isoform X2 [Lepeophtheirus salmonis]